jgi:HAD superfamily hydrolase (TIGR01509 family)
MAVPKALIFDVDGTLAETERDGHRVAFNQAFKAAGLDWHWSEALYQGLIEVAGGKERIRHYWQTYQPDCPIPSGTNSSGTNFSGTNSSQGSGAEPEEITADRFIAQLHQAKTQYYAQLLHQGSIPLRPGVKRLLEEARAQNIRLAIATTSALPNAIALLETTLGPESPDWFEVIAAGDMVPNKKPAPDVYLYVLEALTLAPQDCLVFEDSAQGLQAAIAANLPVIVTTHAYTQHQDFSGARLVLSDLGEPDQPFSVIQGDSFGADFVDIRLLSQLSPVG